MKTITSQPRRYIIISVLVFAFILSLVMVLILSLPSKSMSINELPAPEQIEGVTPNTSRTTLNGIILNTTLPGTKFSEHDKRLINASRNFTQTLPSDYPTTTQIDVSYACYFSMQRFLSTKLDACAKDDNGAIVGNTTKTFVYDLVNKRFVNLSDFIKNDANAYVSISDAISDNLKRFKKIKISKRTISKKITASPNSFSDFLFTNGAIHFVYPENTLAPEEIIVSCSLDELKEEVNPEFFPSENSEDVSLVIPEPTTATVDLDKKRPAKPTKTKIRAKSVALTFDDGPHYKNTKRLLRTLKKYGVKCTFFVLGNLAKSNPSIVKKAYKNGHEIAIHSWSHKQYTKMKFKAIQRDIRKCKRTLKNILGSDYIPRSIRVPYGSYNNKVLKVCKKEKLAVYMWSLDTLDWKNLNKKKNIKVVTKNTRKKDIILMHDIHKTTVASTKDIIINLSKKGYEFVTVDQLVGNSKNGKVYFSGR